MKLLLCNNCGDIFNIHYKEKTCKCGKTKGHYLEDGLNARYSGDYAIPLGIHNTHFNTALKNQPEDGWGKEFTAFVIPKLCPTFIKEEQ